VLDHGATRLAWNGAGSVAGSLTAMIAPHVPDKYAPWINAAGQAVAFGGTYIPINHTYQAHAGDRSAQRADDAAARRAAAHGPDTESPPNLGDLD
jgi:hypothetical protein